ncbi:DUF1549 and DUF1553 domain-containing protein [Tundrisphaera sp. TA3]|uniref:DUF1549 and DUF1553 domain-containing protein n=1 Tax=Tundrisphaera sp. TA3 TaxID=3435775 RepID=UPI003EC0E598
MKKRLAMAGILAMLAARPSRGDEIRPALPPGESAPSGVEFDRHVAGLFGRLGCNAGSCHGSFQGRGGLALSLFGHDPARDFASLTRGDQGRRVNVLDPDRSLVLLKATGRVPHEGGRRFAPDSWEYGFLRTWIAEGARRDPGRPSAREIAIRPPESRLRRPGATGRIEVIARFADGTEADVTPFCDLRSRDPGVVDVSPAGEVRGLAPGDTAVVASYIGLIASARVLIPTGREVAIPDDPDSGLVDREVDAKFRDLGVEPSGPASDAEFLRRVTLDLIGTLPTPEEVRSFLVDAAPDKRTRAIDRLLAHPMHAALWAMRYLDITGCDVAAMEGPDDLRPRRARLWHDWFRARFAANVPYDRIARGVLCATSRDGADALAWARREAEDTLALREGKATDYADRPGLDLFWRRLDGGGPAPVEAQAERVAAAFLGVRIECAQCHKHPLDRWTQDDYRAFANAIADVRFGLSPDGLAATAALLDERRNADPNGVLPPIPRIREVFVARQPSRRLADPSSGRPTAPRALGGLDLPEDGDPRESLADWLARPDNPFFARSFVNRVWAAYFGAGLVDPVDGFSVANPPSNPRLLDALAADFVAHGFDIRRLERLILASRAYQRSSAPAAGNLDHGGDFARSVPRPLMAEVLVDAIDAAAGHPSAFGTDAPEATRAIEVATNRAVSPALARAFRALGRPERASTCDCERPRAPVLSQTLFLMSDESMIARLKDGRVRELAASGRPDAEAVEDLFLASLSRPPSRDEAEAAVDHLRSAADRASGLADILWSLINTREFVLNH